MNATLLYKNTLEYAREHDELDAYGASLKANIACKDAIEGAIRKHFDGMHLGKEAVAEVTRAYGKERACYVVANSVQHKSWDGRFSRSNKEWAAQFEIMGTVNLGYDSRWQFVVESHPAILDGFITALRREPVLERKKPSVLEALNNAPSHPAPKKAAPKEKGMER